MAVSLICSETVSRVSSVLNRDVKQFGKKHMFDSNEETCWNSDQGATQWVLLEFPQEVRVSEVRVQFQGGFTGNTCRIEGCQKDEAFTKLADFYPEDKNSLQISFEIGLVRNRRTQEILNVHDHCYYPKQMKNWTKPDATKDCANPCRDGNKTPIAYHFNACQSLVRRT
ncbi:nuclear receptor 2C2-associated protein-like isoform X1 [Acipenser ruthenus]|uniref:nuclear receptor 2C2-associated protein-like isoform X1 n=1 Tax=Acipenser ruthenus TaxID=7906 RepID=UPI0027411E61|nr:nuclear receptor 2C2-associated protein-like isoform X1 [Acipenser ruthenus]